MRYNDNFGMQDFFMNKELKNLFPQFTKTEGVKNVYSFEWINKKVEDYIKKVLNGCKNGDEIIINGKYKDKLKQIKAMKNLIENMFENIPAITKNIRKNTKLITPFQCVDQLKEIKDPQKKMQVMQIILDNINYNPNFEMQDRFTSQNKRLDYIRRQQSWLKNVGYDNKRRYKW